MKLIKFFVSLLFYFFTSLPLVEVQGGAYAQAPPAWNPNLTSGGANSMLFKFTKQVWLNPTIIIAKQNFEQAVNVKLLILPRLNSNDTTGSSRIEKAFDKLLTFLVYQDNIQGSIKFYFDPHNPAKPFTFSTSDELHCKFTPLEKDTVEQLLNLNIANSSNLNNFTALPFESCITQSSLYCKKILQSKPGSCGPNPENEFTLTQINTTPAKLNFERTPYQQNIINGGVDKQKYAELAQHYNTVVDIADNSNYPMVWKAMAANSNDFIKLKLKKKQNSFDINKLVFKNAAGTETYNTSFQSSDSTISLSMGGKAPGSMAEVVAYYTPAATPPQTFAIGAFNVQFYQTKPLNVVLVSLNNAPIPNANAVRDTLNKIYGNVFINWNVSIASCNLPPEISKSIHIESSGLLSNYMPDMQPIVSHFKDNCPAYIGSAENTYYLLFGCTNDGSQLGYMPRARNTGFIFDVSPHTIAHELGHGAFNLKHIFSSDELGEGNRYLTNNIMDYAVVNASAGQISQQSALYKHQWDLIHDPSFVGWFEGDDEEAALAANQNYFTPAGLPFHATETAQTIVNKSEIENGNKLNGILYAFSTSDGKTYNAKIVGGKFYGYFLAGTSIPYNDRTKFADGSKIKVRTTNYIGNCKVEYFERDYTLTKVVDSLIYINGVDVIASFNAALGKKIGNPILINGCTDYNADLLEGSIGKNLYDTNIGSITPGDTAASGELKRIANLINKLGVALYKSHIQAVKWNEDPESDIFTLFHYAATPLWDKASLNSTFLSIKKYYDAVKQFNDLTTNGNFTTTQIKDIVNQNFVCCNSFKSLFKAPFYQLKANQRNNILKIFLNDTWVTGRINIGDDFKNEDIILNTITTSTDVSQHKQILNSLKDNGLIYELVKNVDGANYEAITTTLTKWVIKDLTTPNIDLIEAIQNKKILHFNDNYFGRNNTNNLLQNGKIVLLVQKWSGTLEYAIVCDPYEYIEVTFQNNFSIGSGSDVATFEENTPYKLPALYVYMLFNADTKAKWMTSAKIAVDIGLLAIGAGEIKAAIQAGEWATASLAVADLGIGFGDIVINTVFINEIETEYPKFFDVWQKVSFCYGIGRMAQVGLTAAYKRCYVESEIIKNKSTYSQSTKNTAQQIKTKLQDPANFAEFIEPTALDQELTFFTNVDNNYTVVTGKIGQMDDETRLAFYEEFKNNPNNTLQTFENNPSQIDNWVQTRVINVGSVYGKTTISNINGFPDNIANLATQQGIDLNTFKVIEEKAFVSLSSAEKLQINTIRNNIPIPDANTILQKVIPKADIAKYLSGDYKQIGGFITTAKDAKHLQTYDDIYYGMRLDYKLSDGVSQNFYLSDGSCGVIRYKTPNANTATIPKCPLNGGDITSPMPFTGDGFTSGTYGRLGVPELKTGYLTPDDGAELWEIFSNGNETLRAKFSSSLNKFIPVP